VREDIGKPFQMEVIEKAGNFRCWQSKHNGATESSLDASTKARVGEGAVIERFGYYRSEKTVIEERFCQVMPKR
jgi:hypothetical protein